MPISFRPERYQRRLLPQILQQHDARLVPRPTSANKGTMCRSDHAPNGSWFEWKCPAFSSDASPLWKQAWRGLAGGGHDVQSDAQSAVADSGQVRVQVCLEERRQKYGKQASAAAAAGLRFENSGGFALYGSVVGDFGGVNVH